MPFSLFIFHFAFLLLATALHAADRPNILLLLAPDWSHPFAGVYRDPVTHTPNFDRVATRGVLFMNAHAAAPTPAASRAALLTGRDAFLPPIDPVTLRLQHAGYTVRSLTSITELRDMRAVTGPWCVIHESTQPRRPFVQGSGLADGRRLQDVTGPFFMPDLPDVRSDMLDYALAIEAFDAEVGRALDELEEAGVLDDTLVIVAGLSGFPFPRGKGTLYDYGTHVPLAMLWRGAMKMPRTLTDFVSLRDLAPTLLEIARLDPPREMTGRSLLPLLTTAQLGGVEDKRDAVVTAALDYPARAIRTEKWAYIINIDPDRWPAGEPELFPGVEDSPTKRFMLDTRTRLPRLHQLTFGKRPAEELYDLTHDRYELRNLADDPEYAAVKSELRRRLLTYLHEAGDTASPRP